ncbi:MAG TPA: hypothetical protein PK507_04035 [bacterium]|nr:hypothetical protein [bacterium]
MGPLSNTLDLISQVGKIGDIDTDDAENMRKALNGTKSITERAKKSLFIYPVIHSPGMSDIDTAMKINKFLEIQYGVFTLLTVGLDPKIENGSIGSYLNSISTESYDENDKSAKENYEVKFNKETNGMESEIWFNEFKTENKDFFNEYARSVEAAGRSENGYPRAYGVDVDKEITTGIVGDMKIEALTKKLRNANPTLISLQLYIKGVANPVAVPIALKTNPHFVNSEDLASLLDAAIEDKRIINRFIKLSSGEISFFRDFLFNLDRVKRDQKLYAKFGQHPWYQQFIQKKESNLFKRFAIIFSTLTNKFKGLVSGMSSSLPTASIVITTDELERAAKMKYGFLVKNEKILWQILNRLSLLCICIYNPEVEMCAYYFNGFKKPMLVPISEMKSDNSDANAEMAKLMNTMLKRGIM